MRGRSPVVGVLAKNSDLRPRSGSYNDAAMTKLPYDGARSQALLADARARTGSRPTSGDARGSGPITPMQTDRPLMAGETRVGRHQGEFVSLEWGRDRTAAGAGRAPQWANLGWTGTTASPDHSCTCCSAVPAAKPAAANSAKWCYNPVVDYLLCRAKRTPRCRASVL